MSSRTAAAIRPGTGDSGGSVATRSFTPHAASTALGRNPLRARRSANHQQTRGEPFERRGVDGAKRRHAPRHRIDVVQTDRDGADDLVASRDAFDVDRDRRRAEVLGEADGREFPVHQDREVGAVDRVGLDGALILRRHVCRVPLLLDLFEAPRVSRVAIAARQTFVARDGLLVLAAAGFDLGDRLLHLVLVEVG